MEEEKIERKTHLDDAIVPPIEIEPIWRDNPEIVKLGDPVLRQPTRPITRFSQEIHNLLKRMVPIMKAAEGLGLAAPQVGRSLRLFIYDVGDGVNVMINPKILSRRGEQTDPPEGCLSIPGLQGTVNRAQEIKVKAFDERGRPVTYRVSDLEARVIQHELDHLDGILFIDRADPESLVWLLNDEEETGNLVGMKE